MARFRIRILNPHLIMVNELKERYDLLMQFAERTYCDELAEQIKNTPNVAAIRRSTWWYDVSYQGVKFDLLIYRGGVRLVKYQNGRSVKKTGLFHPKDLERRAKMFVKLIGGI